MKNFTKIYRAANNQEANLLKGYFSDYGIDTVLVGGNLSMAIGALPVQSQEIDIYVNNNELENMIPILKKYMESLKENSKMKKDWKCASCAEINPENLCICWNCQAYND